ncbi:putative acyl-CoA thioester hydrolase [Piscirickettsia salmonis]|uniref:acyl-CoA thioesterase n=1 Tax=Piscirickettsia salmonis TaxID=1238 RepID=UPI0012BAA9A2|nr:acyl-CoA thioesterase [Piscirickettsia salmonis]QGP56519.1 putative acyl-CoA thioester hydrolase [Piscirickettsia salmonis]QGP61326.1 putative acyl-CoA thioester hydrolase [Piscirickettsia salmonis]QGP66083.1 putative acyl-CoA thioester hydrolase [Piscirickettsia salmonis]
MSEPILPAKTVDASAVHEHVYKIFPNDLNAHRTVFGGLIMATLDRIALVVAERHSGHVCVTVSVDAMHFLAPAKDGDTLIFKAAVNRAWGSSMEIGTKVITENSYTGNQRHILSSYFTFVALDENEQSAKIPAIIAKTMDEQRRFNEAQLRRDLRLQNKQTIAASRQQKTG